MYLRLLGKMKMGNEISRNADPSEPLSALAFKIVTDPFVGTLHIFVYILVCLRPVLQFITWHR